MPRDIQLMKEILNKIEIELSEQPAIDNYEIYELYFKHIPENKYHENIKLLCQSGYLDARDSTYVDDEYRRFAIRGINEKGYDLIEDKQNKTQPSYTFNIKSVSNSNIATQGDATITVNNYYNYNALKDEIAKNGKEDIESLHELNNTINEIGEYDEPSAKTKLMKFKDLIVKNSVWLLPALQKYAPKIVEYIKSFF